MKLKRILTFTKISRKKLKIKTIRLPLTFGAAGNLVLADADGIIAWQTSTANKGVVGFQLLPNGDMVLHDSKGNFIRPAMYYKSPNSPKPYLCTFSVRNGGLPYEFSSAGNYLLARPKYNNGTLSFLRLGSECQLPEKCGKFGLCEDNQCVACPSPNKLAGWSKDCEAVKPSSCGSTNVYYYKLEGVDHTTSKHESGSGSMCEVECGEKCSSDCNAGLPIYDLETLTKVANSTHLGYIMAPKH
ncbi:hypothetical protein Peur_037809 [Populus x canadensis]